MEIDSKNSIRNYPKRNPLNPKKIWLGSQESMVLGRKDRAGTVPVTLVQPWSASYLSITIAEVILVISDSWILSIHQETKFGSLTRSKIDVLMMFSINIFSLPCKISLESSCPSILCAACISIVCPNWNGQFYVNRESEVKKKCN